MDLCMVQNIVSEPTKNLKLQISMNFKTSENGPIVIVKIDTEGLQNLGFRFKEIKSTFFDLERIHNFDEKRKKQSYNIIASLRQINNFQKSKSLSSDIIKMTQIARNNNTTAVIAQAALTFKCSTCNDECFSSYGILIEQLFQQVCGRRLIELRGLFYVINFVETKQCQACQYFHFAPNKNNANNE
ncbi:Hypothetical_protein [Hexamita inflata]|uniref:Hypothetical_protein n=1 Tax=Hexamita inflata TaxID=28002 RepID=A0AA86Q7R1_9EUKA|nr:Hypothetical protein HINF_LOCUS35065 [Hexamita inflata]